MASRKDRSATPARRAHARRQAKAEGLRQQEIDRVNALPITHPHAAGIDGPYALLLLMGMTSSTRARSRTGYYLPAIIEASPPYSQLSQASSGAHAVPLCAVFAPST
jgi:hypothetical protein